MAKHDDPRSPTPSFESFYSEGRPTALARSEKSVSPRQGDQKEENQRYSSSPSTGGNQPRRNATNGGGVHTAHVAYTPKSPSFRLPSPEPFRVDSPGTLGRSPSVSPRSPEPFRVDSPAALEGSPSVSPQSPASFRVDSPDTQERLRAMPWSAEVLVGVLHCPPPMVHLNRPAPPPVLNAPVARARTTPGGPHPMSMASILNPDRTSIAYIIDP
ncbi:hypothetical protein F5B20DRAFT_6825 [Whalleya microplaca]|nr:hypothetical protein F5B20DRAFT_6825 [Whalleya microplaca]